MLVVMVGLPGSGKTTWAEANFRNVVSPDAIRAEFANPFDRANERKVWRRARLLVREHLAAGDVVCFDATSVSVKRRAALGRLAQAAGLPAVAVWIRVPPEIAWQRNISRPRPVPRAAFQQLLEAFQPPSVAEGFAAVLVGDAREEAPA